MRREWKRKLQQWMTAAAGPVMLYQGGCDAFDIVDASLRLAGAIVDAAT